MADIEANAVIVLTVGEPVAVQQTPDEIQNRIETGRPFIELSDTRGTERRIMVSQIVEFHAPVEYRSVGFGNST